MLRFWQAFSSLLLLTVLSCTSVTESNPSRTATEELLISSAADRAAAQLNVANLKGEKVFIDASNFEGTDGKYAIGAIREKLLREGAMLVADKKDAAEIVEIRSGALSTDKKQFLIGIPQFNLPLPLAPTPLTIPEVALFKSEEQKGVAKFGMVSYDTPKGVLVVTQDPSFGFSHNTKKTVLFFISWTDNDALPKDKDQSD